MRSHVFKVQTYYTLLTAYYTGEGVIYFNSSSLMEVFLAVGDRWCLTLSILLCFFRDRKFQEHYENVVPGRLKLVNSDFVWEFNQHFTSDDIFEEKRQQRKKVVILMQNHLNECQEEPFENIRTVDQILAYEAEKVCEMTLDAADKNRKEWELRFKKKNVLLEKLFDQENVSETNEILSDIHLNQVEEFFNTMLQQIIKLQSKSSEGERSSPSSSSGGGGGAAGGGSTAPTGGASSSSGGGKRGGGMDSGGRSHGGGGGGEVGDGAAGRGGGMGGGADTVWNTHDADSFDSGEVFPILFHPCLLFPPASHSLHSYLVRALEQIHSIHTFLPQIQLLGCGVVAAVRPLPS
jgi:hypothetical protein